MMKEYKKEQSWFAKKEMTNGQIVGISVSLLIGLSGVLGFSYLKIFSQVNQIKLQEYQKANEMLDITMHTAQKTGSKNSTQRWHDFLYDQQNSNTDSTLLLLGGEVAHYYFKQARETSRKTSHIVSGVSTVIYFHGQPGVDENISHLLKKVNQTHNILVVSSLAPSSFKAYTPEVLKNNWFVVKKVLKEKNLTISGVTLLGHSMGGASATFVAEQLIKEVGIPKQLLLYKPMTSSQEAANKAGMAPELSTLLKSSDYDLRVNLPKNKDLKTTVVFTKNDESIPFESQEQIPSLEKHDVAPEGHGEVNESLLINKIGY